MDMMDTSLLPMDILNHPWEIVLALLLTIVSTIWSIQGLRRKDIPLFIYGLAAGIPTFAIESWQAWFIAGLCAAFAWWLRQKTENI